MSEQESAILGGGCFWCLEAVYQTVPGVLEVVSGYTGGALENPNYEAICSGKSGHAEVVQVVYDSKITSFETVLEVFWKIHDPTSLNRQGADVGTQYRSVIYYADEKQRAIADASMRKAQSMFSKPIVTEISPLAKFYRAEQYHQNYYNRNKDASYCQYVIRPKLEAYRQASDCK